MFSALFCLAVRLPKGWLYRQTKLPTALGVHVSQQQVVVRDDVTVTRDIWYLCQEAGGDVICVIKTDAEQPLKIYKGQMGRPMKRLSGAATYQFPWGRYIKSSDGTLFWPLGGYDYKKPSWKWEDVTLLSPHDYEAIETPTGEIIISKR